MMTIQPVAYAASLFLSLTCLLQWTCRREVGNRVQRSLRLYLRKRRLAISCAGDARPEAA